MASKYDYLKELTEEALIELYDEKADEVTAISFTIENIRQRKQKNNEKFFADEDGYLVALAQNEKVRKDPVFRETINLLIDASHALRDKEEVSMPTLMELKNKIFSIYLDLMVRTIPKVENKVEYDELTSVLSEALDKGMTFEGIEKETILAAYNLKNRHQKDTAQALNLSVRTIRTKLARYFGEDPETVPDLSACENIPPTMRY